MTRNEFTKIIKTIFDDRNVQNLSSDWLNNSYEVCKGIDLRTAMIGANKLMNISSEDWNGLYGYRGKPSTCDLKTFLSGGKPTSIERRAESEVQKIIDQSKYWHDFSKTNFEDPVTQKVADNYGQNGLSSLHNDLFDTFNINRKNISFVKNDLIDTWLAYYDSSDQPALLSTESKLFIES